MGLRGAEQRAAIVAVLDTFGKQADQFVFIGGCVLSLYARNEGAPLRVTKDVDCISTVKPWTVQQKSLADLCQRGVLRPDPDLACRYSIRGRDVVVDLLSPEGVNVGGVSPWFGRAVIHAATFVLEGDERKVRAVTPSYFLGTKLIAFLDRGPDAQSSKDAEDIVTLAVEVPDLPKQVNADGIATEVRQLWKRIFTKYGLRVSDIEELVTWHLDRRDKGELERVVAAITDLASD